VNAAIVLLGEPRHWETPLQLLVDLLRTNGKPDAPVDVAAVNDVPQLPVIACNMDLQFMERACIPRSALHTASVDWCSTIITARNKKLSAGVKIARHESRRTH